VCQHDSHSSLTAGKPYEVLGENEDGNKVFVIDDNGKKNSFYKSRFVEESITA
jgi:hypothetical protein